MGLDCELVSPAGCQSYLCAELAWVCLLWSWNQEYLQCEYTVCTQASLGPTEFVSMCLAVLNP